MLEEFTDLMWEHGAWLAEHGSRVARIATSLGRHIGLETEQLRRLHVAAHLHDIGKIKVDAALVNKPSPLTALEWREMRRHPVDGFWLLEGLVHPEIAATVLAHHERFDGLGYPFGISGSTIPQSARILFVADAFDAITSDRPYEPAQPVEVAITEIRRCSGTQFDPEVVDAMIATFGSIPVGAPVSAA